MSDFYVKINREKIKIEEKVFLELLDLSPIKEFVAYKKAISNKKISFSDLKDLASKADIPYPLFFAPLSIVNKQVKNKNKQLFEKLPSKMEMRLSSRGEMSANDIELIAKDLGRKQEFLKTRILTESSENPFLGFVSKKIKVGVSNQEIAEDIKEYLDIDLDVLRGLSKDGVLEYLVSKSESKSILVSFSSHNFMPQRLNKDLGLSGICIKDKKFPYIFINTRDGDEKPKIIEASGRQIFTLLSMLVSISMNKFVFSSTKGKIKSESNKRIYSIVGEILIPKNDIIGLKIRDLDDLKLYSGVFKVTPSMLLMRLKEEGLVSKKLSDIFWAKLFQEVKDAEPKQKNHPLLINGYGKYNGVRFSQEVIRAHKKGLVSGSDVKNILFRKGKMNPTLLSDYSQKFK